MKKLLLFSVSLVSFSMGYAQTANTSPLPSGETVIGNHLHAGQNNEVWTDATTLYFNYRGSAATTHFWNMGNSTGKTIMTLLNSGYVGIGTPTPASMLHISSPVERNTFRIYKSTNASNYLSIWQGDGGAAIDPIGTGLLFLGYDQVTTVSMNGKLGIGTTSPSAQLHVLGPSTGHGLTILADGGGDVMLNSGGSLFFDGNYSYASGNYIRPVSANTQTFVTSGVERMRITNSGYIGIGTSSPDAKLSVSGQVHAQEVKVSITVPSPDYVFSKDYKLTSLEEIKNYIDQNKHLPEVPSAKEMEKNGVQLGEMNMLLLKKIEELTLYVIELKKANDSANEKMKNMQIKINQLMK